MILQVAITAHSHREATIKSLAAEQSLAPSTASRQVRLLASRGLVTFNADVKDRRRTIVQLTAEAQSLATLYFQSLHAIFYEDRAPELDNSPMHSEHELGVAGRRATRFTDLATSLML